MQEGIEGALGLSSGYSLKYCNNYYFSLYLFIGDNKKQKVNKSTRWDFNCSAQWWMRTKTEKKTFYLESSESCVERNKDKSCCHFNWSDKIIDILS